MNTFQEVADIISTVSIEALHHHIL